VEPRTAEFSQTSLGAFTFAMGQWPVDDLRDYLVDNPVHHLDLARYFLGELSELEAHITEVPTRRHAIAAIARADSGAVCTFNFCTTANWDQRNEWAEVYGTGHAVWVENVDTCVYRPPEGPQQIWRPNYTVPWGGTASPIMMGFQPALEHFRKVATGEASNLSDMSSAAATLRLAERLCELASARVPRITRKTAPERP
jgi:UDP-N-acetylglucosamine 3-dehydrogenase